MSELGWKYLTSADKKAILRGIADGHAYGGPYHVEIHPADRCNIDCFFCSTAAIRGTDELSPQRFNDLLAELRELGTRAIRFSGGGEPLFHRKIKEIVRRIIETGIPIENITTNAVLLDEELAGLLTQCCDQVTVSLNTADPESYAAMMQTSSRNYERVLTNVRRLVAVRRQRKARRPLVNIQFLVWRENYRTIPRMYDLARDLGADTIFFNGLSSLQPSQRMDDTEVVEMLRLYEDLIRRDQLRTITSIGSFERDISSDINGLIARLGAERNARPLLSRVRELAQREGSWRDKIRHHFRMRRNRRIDQATEGLEPACMIGWYSMLIRSNGIVAPCCILQHKVLGDINTSKVGDIWHGPDYMRFRAELTRIIRQRDAWRANDEQTVESICGLVGTDLCPMKSYYFARDVQFMQELHGV